MAEKRDSTPPQKPKVLDLIDDKKKPSRRERQRQEAEATQVAQQSAVEKAKETALDIFNEDGKKKKNTGVRKTERSGKAVLPTISKLLEEPEEAPAAEVETPAPAPAPAAAAPAPVAAAPVEAAAVGDDKVISIKTAVTVNDLAARMGLKPFQLMADLIKLQVFVAPNQPIDPEIAAKLCELHGFTFEKERREKGTGVHKVEEVVVEPVAAVEEPEEQLKHRPPIITIMGHVDHGKTTLLDCIRKSRVTAGEAGGITQHIGAYQVVHNGHPITFLDTPGHSIFSDMRARGADITDIVVLVVAANDGIMPQTREAIDHAKAAKKTIIVAINKCDLPSANPMHVKTQLAEVGLQTTDFGGDTEFAEISALNGKGVDDLLELMALQAEVLELKSNPKANARASVIEARVVQGRGPTATVIVESGTLKVGMPFICGPYSGKIKALVDDTGKSVKKAPPGMPVEVVGFEETPNVGDQMVEMESERDSKKLATERQEDLRRDRLKTPQKSRMEDMFQRVTEGGGKTQLRVVLKCDVQGSVEAIRKALQAIESTKVEANIVVAAAGPITEKDIQMASSSDSVVIGFNVKVESNAVKLAKSEGVQVKLFSVVYELIDQVREAMSGLLEPMTRETVLGHAEVRQIFKLSKSKGRAAGSYVTDGKINRKAHARVIRGGVPVFDGKMSTLRRFQDEVQEVKLGFECGIRLGDFNEYVEGDVIECYQLEKVPQTL